MTVTLAVDMMGGDKGLAVTAPGIRRALQNYSNLHCLLVGRQTDIVSLLGDLSGNPNVEIVQAAEVVDMHESPATALRSKKNSSMRVAINLVAEGRADACVSAGNTGALMATARFVLRMLPGVDRPAIISALPRADSHVHMLDLGANVDSSPEILLQFGLMAVSMVRSLEHVQQPTIGLLNVGSEDIKGSEIIKRAADLFKASEINYVGYVEGDDIFQGEVDIIVCDGFAGNVALKTSEGLAQMLVKVMREEYTRNLWTRLAAFLSIPVLRSFRARVDHRRYNGAVLLGLNGTVVKSHGGADSFAFSHAIEVAREAVENKLLQRLRADFSGSETGKV
ncbi:MAG TPA: phosphate acyltransferase PlsX [Gammaproteobacteria bacterium]|nr:phosphate acyltransferase [Acidiferrobacteraceae bacterium]MDP6141315.1 phosphate acyltransferase PlsX [Arenicellales bacterium]HCV19930.1 phosphate acyltransferase PlsX [Gammaproteobacteria bacterium]MDP6292069.1 phosphate acyltransferase PlsX [Arenicellales bacterium]MDP7489714.1 phosphate acyltransferase PlsX [Arenicellales bacterium]